MDIAKYRILQTLHRADVSAFVSVSHWPALPAWQSVAKCISRTADGWLYPLIPLLLMWQKPTLALPLFYVLSIGYALERLLYFTLKKGFRRNRPPKIIPGYNSAIQASDEFSFPSGHTSAAFFAVTVLLLFFPTTLTACLYFWSLAVAFSRIVLGVHFPLDTLAGALLGSLTALMVFNLAL